MEEEERRELLTLDEIEALAAESSHSLHDIQTMHWTLV